MLCKRRIIIFLLSWLMSMSCLAGNSMRCSKGIVSEGDSVSLLLIKCGEPIYREPTYATQVNQWGRVHQFPIGELLIYDMGKNHFYEFVSVENDQIRSIEEGPRN